MQRETGRRFELARALSTGEVVERYGKDFWHHAIGNGPFTLASYAIEGGHSNNFAHTKSLMYGHPAAWHRFCDLIADVIGDYLVAQVEAGVDVVQVFDRESFLMTRRLLAALYARPRPGDNPDVAGAVTDPRAGVLRQRYHTLFADPELPVPVHRIAEDLLGLQVVEAELAFRMSRDIARGSDLEPGARPRAAVDRTQEHRSAGRARHPVFPGSRRTQGLEARRQMV